MVRVRKGRKLQLLPTEAEGGDSPAVEEDESYEEEVEELEKRLYELEAIRQKRIRKGAPQYLIKWRGYPEVENTWEPLENLKSCTGDIELFEKSLKAGKKTRKHRQKGAASQPNKRQQTYSRATPSAEVLDGAPEPAIVNNVLQLGIREKSQDGTPETLYESSSPIVKLLGPIRSNTGNDVHVIFTAVRADGTKNLVDNRYLKASYPDLLLDFYEQRFCAMHGIV